MYRINMVIRNTDENDKKYKLFEVDEDEHEGDYIADIFYLVQDRLELLPDDDLRFECGGGPLDHENLEDECAFYLNTKQIEKLFQSLQSFPPIGWVNFKELLHMSKFVKQLDNIIKSVNGKNM
ncbi:MAG: hypothetical protein KKE62_06035 [Proteobacteria bacterium]|nr:hypothetical protein [Pseudomonadota bacterium]MBU1542387.1 hypothetical protein [Pseudomonadota bacterium]MBU2429656.1 hypothetical protein [Pseudomonadota bacterium]MBU2481178.1 hypothetical protein [Pseudomonadota bacterium]